MTSKHSSHDKKTKKRQRALTDKERTQRLSIHRAAKKMQMNSGETASRKVERLSKKRPRKSEEVKGSDEYDIYIQRLSPSQQRILRRSGYTNLPHLLTVWSFAHDSLRTPLKDPSFLSLDDMRKAHYAQLAKQFEKQIDVDVVAYALWHMIPEQDRSVMLASFHGQSP